METITTTNTIEKKSLYLYNSYNLDEINYSLEDISRILNGGTSNLSDKDIAYIKNFSLAYDYWEELNSSKNYTQFTEQDFLDLHKKLMQGIDNDNAGEYRTVCAVFSGSRKLMPVPQKLPYIIGDIFYDIENHNGDNVLDFAIDIHFRIIDAYPFVEKNRDMARFMFNTIYKSIDNKIVAFDKSYKEIYKEIEEETNSEDRKVLLKKLIQG